MDVLNEERKKLKEVQKQYHDFIIRYQDKIKKIPIDYKNNPLMQTTLLEQFTGKLQLLEKTINTPFFGRIDFLHDQDLKDTVCYIGKVGILDDDGNPITVDWRSPISSLYYDSNVGLAEYMAPDGLMKGTLKLKRQFDIQEGELIHYQDVNTVSNDELLKPYLSTNADSRLKNIVATIQGEQNAIIRKSIYKNYIIQGTAGSGKTTVALHRTSYLIYNEQKSFKENQFMVIGPNAYFMNYISSVLPDLDVHSVIETTFLDIVNDYLKEKIKVVDQNARLEKILNGEELNLNISFKSSLDYKKAIDLFIRSVEDHIIHGPITLRNVVLFSEDEMRRFFSKKTLGILERMKEFKKYAKKELKEKVNYFKDLYWKQYRDEYLNLNESDKRREEILLDTASFDLEITKNRDHIIQNYFQDYNLKPILLYQLFIENIKCFVSSDKVDLDRLKNETLEGIKKKTLGYEDLPALLYLNLKFNGYQGYDHYIHVVVDEAQDYGLFHFFVLKELFKNSTFSIFGDLAQSIYSYQSIDSWESVIDQVFHDNISLLKLEKSYRTTYEIMEAANLISKWFGFGDGKAVLRHGNKVEIYKLNENHVVECLGKRINEFKKLGFKSIAIICKSELEVSRLAKLFLKKNMVVNQVTSKNVSYDGGICFISSYLAKGLEFDAVIVFSVDQYDINRELDMKLLYVAMTRALHQLDITYQKEIIYPLKKLEM
mgnify:FL=1